MPDVTVGILSETLKVFVENISGGYSRIYGWARLLLQALALLDLTLAGLWWMFAKGEALTGLIQRLLMYGLFVWLVAIWPMLIDSVITGFTQVGLRVGGSSMSVGEFTNPSKIAGLGLIATEPLFLHIRDYGFFSGVKNLGDVLITGICGLLIVAAFFVVAIQVFVLFIEFYIAATSALILLPFGVNQYTAWIAEGTFATILGHGIKLMILACITSLAFPVLAQLGMALPPDPSFKQILSLLVGAWAITGLCYSAPSIAAGWLAHSPALTAGMAAGTLAGGALIAGYIGQAARETGRSATSAVQSVARLARRRT